MSTVSKELFLKSISDKLAATADPSLSLPYGYNSEPEEETANSNAYFRRSHSAGTPVRDTRPNPTIDRMVSVATGTPLPDYLKEQDRKLAEKIMRRKGRRVRETMMASTDD